MHFYQLHLALIVLAWIGATAAARADDKPLSTIPVDGEVRQLAFSPDGKLLAASVAERGGTGLINIEVFSRPDYKRVKTFANVAATLAFSPDSKWLAITGLCGFEKIMLHDTSTWKWGPRLIERGIRPEPTFTRFAFSPDGKQVLSATAGGIVELWDIASEKRIQTWTTKTDDKPAAISYLGFNAAGTPLIALGTRNVIVRELTDPVKDIGPLNIGYFTVHVAALSPDGRSFATAGVEEPKLFDLTSGKLKSDLQGVTGHTYGMAFTSDGRHLITGGNDCHGKKDGTSPAAVQVRVWDATNGQEVGALSGKLPLATTVAVAADGKSFATGSDRQIAIWDLRRMTEVEKGSGSPVLAKPTR